MRVENRQVIGGLVLGLALSCSVPASAKLAINGKEADQKALKEYLAKCEDECRSFRQLLQAIKDDKKVSVTLNVGRDQKKVAIDAFESPGKMTVDLADLEKFPRPKKNGKKWEFPSGVPAWAGTFCEELAHILAEAYDSAKDGPAAKQEKSHKVALKAQAEIRDCYGQSE